MTMTVDSSHDPVKVVLDCLKEWKKSGKGYVARCPAHEDSSPSLSIGHGRDGRAVLNCHAGCSFDAIVAALGLEKSDLFTARPEPPSPVRLVPPARQYLLKSYDYVDEQGALLYQALRYEPKDFRQRRPDGSGGWLWNMEGVRYVPYHLPDVLEAVRTGRPVYVVEGEKDADALAELGYMATTNVAGAGKWRQEYSAHFRGAQVVVLPDNDDAGRSHGEQVAASVAHAGASVKIVALPGLAEKGDVSDWLNDGHDLDELERVVGRTRPWALNGKRRRGWLLREILSNDEIMRPPPPVVPYLAWGGRSTLLAGADKAGKSTLIGFLAAQVSRGGEFLREPCHRGAVLIVSLEEAMGDTARRILKFGGNEDLVTIIPLEELPSDPKQRPSVLREAIGDWKPILTVVDTLIAWGEGLVNDMSSSAQTAPIVNALTSVSHETGTALTLVHHARRSDGRYRDSSAIGGAVDVVAELFVPDEDQDATLRKLRVKGRMGVHPAQFRFDGDTYLLDMGDEAPLEYRIREFVRSKVKCSMRDVEQGVKGRAETIRFTVIQMIADNRLRNLTPDRKHMTLMATADEVKDFAQWWDQ